MTLNLTLPSPESIKQEVSKSLTVASDPREVMDKRVATDKTLESCGLNCSESRANVGL